MKLTLVDRRIRNSPISSLSHQTKTFHAVSWKYMLQIKRRSVTSNPHEIVLDWDDNSEPELKIHYNAQSQPTSRPTKDSDDSENAPLFSHTCVPYKINPDRLEVTFGDKTSTVIINKQNVSRKTLAEETPDLWER